MGGLLLRIGIIGAIAGGAWIFRDYISGNATDLAVGDCFDAPSTTSETVEDVAHHPCTDAHTAEVFYVADYTDSTTYPGEDAFDAFTQANCPPAFQAYWTSTGPRPRTSTSACSTRSRRVGAAATTRSPATSSASTARRCPPR